jgi:hypothetical protein
VSDTNWEVEQENDTDVVKTLRAKYKAEKKAREEAEVREAAATKSLGVKTLGDVLKAKQLSPALAKWIEKDDVDITDSAAIDTWLTENAEVFGIQLEAEPAPEPHVSEEDQQGFDSMQVIQGSPAPANPSKVAKVESVDVTKYSNNQDLYKALVEAGK